MSLPTGLRRTQIPALLIVLLMAAMIGLGACTPVYRATSPQIPLFSGGGEVRAAAHASTSAYEGQLAFSPADGFAVGGTASTYRSNSLTYPRQQNAWEVAGGYYAMPGSFGDSGVRMEVFAGYGQSQISTYLHEPFDATPLDSQHTVEANYHRYLLQLNIGYSLPLNSGAGGQTFSLEFGSASRLSILHFTNYFRDSIPSMMGDATLAEHFLFVRFGLSFFQLEGIAGGVLPLNADPDFDATFLYFAVGARVALGTNGW